jgi:septum formation protein
MWTDHNIILASKSPRRSELLDMARIPYQIVTADTPEIHPIDTPAHEIPLHLARLKAMAVQPLVGHSDIVIGADTVVILAGKIYEKPTDRADAMSMLRALSGQTHLVVTGVCMRCGEREVAFSETTAVSFNPLTDEMITYYLDHYQPYDKAGSYACQEWIGAVGIRRMEGDYYNVVGLPINRLYRELQVF